MHEPDISNLIKRLLKAEAESLSRTSARLGNGQQVSVVERENAKARILKSLELHWQADDFVEAVVARYREDLYSLARDLSGDSGIVTSEHCRQASAWLYRRRPRYGWADGCIACGCLLLGVSIPPLLGLLTGLPPPHPAYFLFGLAGAGLFGMGAVAKAKS